MNRTRAVMRHLLSICPLKPLALSLVLAAMPVAVSAEISADGLALVRDTIDRGHPAEALELMASMTKGRPSADELLVRGMAKMMLGELKTGAADLEAAVDKDPSLRDGWLNLAGLEIAESNYEKALKLLRKAHDLAPEKADIHLNLGAVLLQLGRRDEALKRFDRYLELDKSSEARYLVAANHAMVGEVEPTLEHLAEAISLNERLRLQARRDERFASLDDIEYRILLHSDSYQTPADHRQAAAAFGVAYNQRKPKLLYAVMDALKELNLGFDPEIETTARWALIWGPKMRIKVHTQGNGTGVVSVSSPPSSFTAESWKRTTEQLFRVLHRRLGPA